MRRLLMIFLILLPLITYAAEDSYQFQTKEDQARFSALTGELRCLVCQNETLAASNAVLASDLRGQIYQKMIQGKTDKEIVDYLVERYGNFILYRPPLHLTTVGLWFGPFLLLILSIGYLLYYVRKNQREKR